MTDQTAAPAAPTEAAPDTMSSDDAAEEFRCRPVLCEIRFTHERGFRPKEVKVGRCVIVRIYRDTPHGRATHVRIKHRPGVDDFHIDADWEPFHALEVEQDHPIKTTTVHILLTDEYLAKMRVADVFDLIEVRGVKDAVDRKMPEGAFTPVPG